METPTMKDVVSSNIRQIGFDSKKRDLFVRFNNGALYVYRNVPPVIYEGMEKADSKGTYLNQTIKNHYPYEKLEEGTKVVSSR